MRILVEDLKRIPLLIHPEHLSRESGKDLQPIFTELTSRSVNDISAEITKNKQNVFDVTPDRLALDDIIFDALNLTQGEREGVYEAVIHLVEARLQKASSLRGS